MGRSETRKRIIVFLMAALVLLSVPAAWLRMEDCVFEDPKKYNGQKVPGRVIFTIMEEPGSILGRDGSVFCDGVEKIRDSEVLGNLMGRFEAENLIWPIYSDDLMVNEYSLFWGHESVRDKVGMQMTTTFLPAQDLYTLKEAFQGYDGVLFCYNYETGEIYTMLSLPCSLEADARDMSYENRCTDYRLIPGSTMKMVALICAMSQDPGLREFTYTCQGQDKLGDGSDVVCQYAHGTVDLVGAMGVSCNCYFSKLIAQLDVDRTRDTLQTLGITVEGEEKARKLYLEQLRRTNSYMVFDSNESYDSVWGLIGQSKGEGHSAMSVIDMAMIAGAVAQEGVLTEPHFVTGIYDPNRDRQVYTAPDPVTRSVMDPQTAQVVREIWTEAVNANYRSGSNEMVSAITFAKTGTAERSDGGTNRLLVGVMEGCSTAFFIQVDELDAQSPLAIQIANTLAQVLEERLG